MHEIKRKVRPARYGLSPVALVVCAMLYSPSVRAQLPGATTDAPILLKRSPMLQEHVPDNIRRELPTFLEGARMTGRTDLETVVEGGAVLRRGDMMIRADRLEYYQPDDLAKARGNVRLNRAIRHFAQLPGGAAAVPPGPDFPDAIASGKPKRRQVQFQNRLPTLAEI